MPVSTLAYLESMYGQKQETQIERNRERAGQERGQKNTRDRGETLIKEVRLRWGVNLVFEVEMVKQPFCYLGACTYVRGAGVLGVLGGFRKRKIGAVSMHAMGPHV